MSKYFMYASKHFKLCVYARSRRAADQYVKDCAMKSLAHRELKFVGEGVPPENEHSWVMANAFWSGY